MKRVLITGSSGLIGSEAVEYFDRQGHQVIGVDNNMRRVFFGERGDTTWNLRRLKRVASRFEHRDIDIRNREAIFALFKEHRFDAILHCAAQPSHVSRAYRVHLEIDERYFLRFIPSLRHPSRSSGRESIADATMKLCPVGASDGNRQQLPARTYEIGLLPKDNVVMSNRHDE